jgi:hypothetical protein
MPQDIREGSVVGSPAVAERDGHAEEARAFAYHEKSVGQVNASAERVFAHLDGHARLAAHMERRSWRMGWGRIAVHLDEEAGRAVGSQIRMEGTVLGIRLHVEEIVTKRVPPTRKVWQTVGVPRLVVIGSYRMGFVIEPAALGDGAVMLSVFIDYHLCSGWSRPFGRLVGRWYARWCTSQMVADAMAAFATPA